MALPGPGRACADSQQAADMSVQIAPGAPPPALTEFVTFGQLTPGMQNPPYSVDAFQAPAALSRRRCGSGNWIRTSALRRILQTRGQLPSRPGKPPGSFLTYSSSTEPEPKSVSRSTSYRYSSNVPIQRRQGDGLLLAPPRWVVDPRSELQDRGERAIQVIGRHASRHLRTPADEAVRPDQRGAVGLDAVERLEPTCRRLQVLGFADAEHLDRHLPWRGDLLRGRTPRGAVGPGEQHEAASEGVEG